MPRVSAPERHHYAAPYFPNTILNEAMWNRTLEGPLAPASDPFPEQIRLLRVSGDGRVDHAAAASCV